MLSKGTQKSFCVSANDIFDILYVENVSNVEKYIDKAREKMNLPSPDFFIAF